MKATSQLLLGIVLLLIVMAIGVCAITHQSMPFIFTVIQYTLAVISGVVLGDAIFRLNTKC